MKIRLAADLQEDSIVDGKGIRTVIWTQGCSHNCKGCHNPNTHDFNGGELVELDDVIERLEDLPKENDFIDSDIVSIKVLEIENNHIEKVQLIIKNQKDD